MADEIIRGYRPLGDRPKSKAPSTDHLHPTSEAAKLLKDLRTEAARIGTPCMEDPDKWIPDDLPTDREAQMMCAACPLLNLCEAYRSTGHPAWGVWAGKVQGRALAEAMKEDNDE